jgi:hypothetical protein
MTLSAGELPRKPLITAGRIFALWAIVVIGVPVALFLWWFIVPPNMYINEHKKAVAIVADALQAYRAARGRFPKSLAELQPAYLANPPPYHPEVTLRYVATPSGDACWMGFDAFHSLMPADDFHEYDCLTREWRTRPFGEAKITPTLDVEEFPKR